MTYIPKEAMQTTAFGELNVESKTPQIQIKFPYGIVHPDVAEIYTNKSGSTHNDIQLIGVPNSSLDDVWESAKPMLQKGIDYGDGELEIDDIYGFLKDRAMQLWVLYNYTEGAIVMAAVTEIVNYPRTRLCRAVVLGGDRVDDWMDNLVGLEVWAKSMGCDKMEAFGRRGLAKKMEKIGYRNKYVVIRKDL